MIWLCRHEPKRVAEILRVSGVNLFGCLISSEITVRIQPCEQFHSELKTDMDVERLPSGDYKTNSLILSLSTLSFNVLLRLGRNCRQAKAFQAVFRRLAA